LGERNKCRKERTKRPTERKIEEKIKDFINLYRNNKRKYSIAKMEK
jgi:hypothetical protein